MSILGHVCEDVCPAHRSLCCHLERGHDGAHRARLVRKIDGHNWPMDIEWRYLPEDTPVTKDTILLNPTEAPDEKKHAKGQSHAS